MRLIGLMPARNEDWVIGLSARVALMWCDALFVLQHACIDQTARILREIEGESGNRGRLLWVEESDAMWAEMAHRQRMLDFARQAGASHIALIDADEVLTGDLLPTIRRMVEVLPLGHMLQIPMRNMYGGIMQYRNDRSIWGRPITTVAFADAPDLCWRAQNGYEHHHREPHGARLASRIYPGQLDGGVMHLQFVSRRRLLAKHALYKMNEVLRWPTKDRDEIDRMYSQAPDWSGAHFEATPSSWWWPYQHLLPYLHPQREPWQEAECARLWRAHGADAFAGLDLFGVVDECALAR